MDDVKLYGRDGRELGSLVNTVRIFSDNTRMEFGMKKCGILTLKRGKVERSEGILLPDARKIKSVEEESYQYPGILEHDDLLHGHMKRSISGD